MNNNTNTITNTTTTYNGWSNWDTWNSYNWITDDELMYRRAARSTDANHLYETMENYIIRVNDCIDIDNVNWVELYDALNEGV
jgi:hypothetical protein